MLDLPALRKKHKIITVSEFLRLRGLSPSLEATNGAWLRETYHEGNTPLSLYSIPNRDYDQRVILVDFFTETGVTLDSHGSPLDVKLTELAGVGGVVPWMTARIYAKDKHSDEATERELLQSGWVTLHTFYSLSPNELFKAPVMPFREVAAQRTIQGWTQRFANLTEDVLLLEGETHLGRKPGGMRFTSLEAARHFTNVSLRDMHSLPQVLLLATELGHRMRQKVQGRMWIAVHMRRGDCRCYSGRDAN